MKQAFLTGEDIHTVTAAQVFGVPSDQVTKQMRSHAKAVNFGIVYGISAFSLAQDIGVPVYEAKEYIETYFERFPGIRRYMDEVVAQAKERGYVEIPVRSASVSRATCPFRARPRTSSSSQWCASTSGCTRKT